MMLGIAHYHQLDMENRFDFQAICGAMCSRQKHFISLGLLSLTVHRILSYAI